MKFKLVENIHDKYYRYVLHDPDENVDLSLFIELGKYLKKLYNADDESYDDLNYALSQIEQLMQVPDLDFNNKHYNFAFTKNFLDKYKDEIDELGYCIHEYTPYELKLVEVTPDHIDYEDEEQVAWQLDESIKNFNEELHIIKEGFGTCYYTYSINDIVAYIKKLAWDNNKGCRILIDERNMIYLVGDLYTSVHYLLFKGAIDSGLYDEQEEYIKQIGGADSYYYKGIGNYLYQIIYVPDSIAFDLGEDNYDHQYNLSIGGRILTTACTFEDCILYPYIRRYIESEQNL